ncbi:MAG: EAL domain-containing response regulator [Burkholderiales bacterium]
MDMWPAYADSLPVPLECFERGVAVRDAMPVKLAADPRTQPRILLVDDDPFMLGMQSRTLRGMGYQMIGTAGSADVALTMLGSKPDAVDVVVCDLNMPGVDGIEFLQRLNASAFRGSVILLSGEGVGIMHSVRKLLAGGNLVILGALEKPAARSAIRTLLDPWSPSVDRRAEPPVFRVIEAELCTANRERQWLLHYQPKVDLTTGALVGTEALIRWSHPIHGLIYPDRFIGAAEELGAIDGVTDWVLREAVQQLSRWHAGNLRIQMAVNVSMDNLRSPSFAQRLSALVHGSFVSPQDLTLELTESRLMSPGATTLESLVRLRMQRFGLSIDDFGTGHSSLAQLRDVPFTELKIDRGFVQGARDNRLIRPILEGSIGIAKRMGLRSVAEGVETEDDWHLLREIGCDQAQGYFIGRPMPGKDIPAWHADWKTKIKRSGLIGS